MALLPRLWRFALAQTRQRGLAEDLVQQTCQRALEKRGQFTPGTRQDHWMFAIMSSLWKNTLRGEKLRRGLGRVEASDLCDDGRISEIDEALLHSQLLRAVLELPEWQREAVMLVYVEELSYRQASETLAIPIGTVMSRLASAKTALAAKFSAPGDDARKDRFYHGKRL